MTKSIDLIRLWQDIVSAGGRNAYVEKQLRERGFLVEQKETATMNARELERYKKELKQEAAEKKKIRKETWQAYKASHIVHVGEGIYFNDADDMDLRDLPDGAERLAENDLPRMASPSDLAKAMGLGINRIRWLAYHRDAASRIHYRRFFITKRDGSQRPIWAPLPQLKAAQRWIMSNIAEKLPVHGACHGFLLGRSILSNARVHRNAKFIVKFDIKDFFPSVTFARVKGLFRKAGYQEQVAILLALICTEAPREIVEYQGKTWYVSLGPRCLPQGAPTSPAITNTLCLSMDRRLSGLAAKHGWRYTRYADDLTFSFPAESKDSPQLNLLLGAVPQIVKEEGFVIHPEKTRILRPGGRQTVTGLVVNENSNPRVPRKLKRQIRAAIHNLKKGQPLKEGESPQTLAGYAAYIRMSDPKLGKHMQEELLPYIS